MNILVCVKQVPDPVEIKFNSETASLIRACAANIVNPFDKYALELALQLKEKHGGEVTVLTMGPPQAVDALKECYAMGADKIVLASDSLFEGGDTLATSYALFCAIKKTGEFDLILYGKQAIDGNTAQVGPQVAERLGVAQATCATGIELADDKVLVAREQDDCQEIIEVKMPALVTVAKLAVEPRNPNIRRKIAANKIEMPVISAADLEGIDAARLGLTGSAVKVKKMFAPPVRGAGIKIENETADNAVKALVDYLSNAKAI
ncbi:electron transfer flavoprotein subunit beta/FixA family protein [Pelotomaculum propionicicum]|uniref:Electron transfer flavoprotein small subunit n=1 Tax=Pelotomaculum propionicicum TaxID=258475 RepID=A0A4Y7RK38_9FIRM|nr:electron transfer flavoprotein subunit beta/FixA family protein [Pelotomaculum propionicicum]TEB09110.1 Caffeyl-CoA reductase-Etf complex subunit CarD [Pelotomaculum propionicicum]